MVCTFMMRHNVMHKSYRCVCMHAFVSNHGLSTSLRCWPGKVTLRAPWSMKRPGWRRNPGRRSSKVSSRRLTTGRIAIFIAFVCISVLKCWREREGERERDDLEQNLRIWCVPPTDPCLSPRLNGGRKPIMYKHPGVYGLPILTF